jgi:DNA (cytosine-5)-methyltransferase 1
MARPGGLGPVVSLYSGAGGLDLGFVKAGFEVTWANDNDPWACKTYARHLGHHIVCGDVLTTAPPGDLKPQLLIGGPPCQGFSVIGKMRKDDPRSRHVFHFIETAERLGVRGFVLENVKALARSPRWQPIRDALLGCASAAGYTTRLFVLNAADYGVPQARERMFLVGIRGADPLEPPPVTSGSPRTVRDALSSLPRYGEPGNDSRVSARIIPAAEPIMRPTPFRGSLLFNGSGRPLDLDSPAKTLPASMGGNATPIVDQLELDEGTEPWVVGYHRRLLEGKPPLRRVPGRLRRLTVEEAAALQTFPRDWKFQGPTVAQLRQIGNAVPVELARHVGLAVAEALAAAKSSDARRLEARQAA